MISSHLVEPGLAPNLLDRSGHFGHPARQAPAGRQRVSGPLRSGV